MTIHTKEEYFVAKEYLQEHIHREDTVFILPKRILQHGKSMEVAVLIKHPELGIDNISEFIAITANQYKLVRNTTSGLIIPLFNGCEYHLVNNLSYFLFDEGYQLTSAIV